MVMFNFLKNDYPSEFCQMWSKTFIWFAIFNWTKNIWRKCPLVLLHWRDQGNDVHAHHLFFSALSGERCLIHTASKSLCKYSMHRKGCFKEKKRVCGIFEVCFQSKNNDFWKRGRRSGRSHRARPEKGREKGTRAASWVSQVPGQEAPTAAESRIHDRFFGSWSKWYCSSKTAHITFTPNTLWPHKRKALIIPGIWSS